MTNININSIISFVGSMNYTDIPILKINIVAVDSTYTCILRIYIIEMWFVLNISSNCNTEGKKVKVRVNRITISSYILWYDIQ